MTYVIEASQQPFVVETAPNQISVVEVASAGVSVISVGLQGPAGPPGSNTVAGATLAIIAASTISAYTVVGLTGGQGSQADSGNLAYCDTVCGIATAGTLTGATCPVQYTGIIEHNGWNWTLGKPIFLGSNGALTQTPPISGFCQQIGIPLSSSSILISIQAPIRIN